MTLTTRALTVAVRDRARALGFDRVAVGPAAPAAHGAAFERWLDAGYAGEMAYMERTRHQRLDPSRLLPGARSVIAVAMLYAPAERAAATQGKIARYAGGRDYHDVIRPRLNTLARFIEDAAGGETRSRAAVDTSAVLERDLAAAAGPSSKPMPRKPTGAAPVARASTRARPRRSSGRSRSTPGAASRISRSSIAAPSPPSSGRASATGSSAAMSARKCVRGTARPRRPVSPRSVRTSHWRRPRSSASMRTRFVRAFVAQR